MAQWNRRNFMKGSLATPSVVHSVAASAGAGAQTTFTTASADPVVDTHVYISQWPARRVAGDQPEELVNGLRRHGVHQAWAGSFDALLHKDIGAVNERLATDCSRYGQGLLQPFGAVNPRLPAWEEDVRRWHEEVQMPGIRVHPGYHSYTLEDPVFAKLLRMCAERNLILQIAAWMEDERTHVPALEAPIVDLQPLATLLESVPNSRVMVLNGFISLRSVQLPWERLKNLENLAFDIAMLEQLMGVKVLVDAIGVERVVFGSYSPMFYFESAFLKIQEADIPLEQTKAIQSENAGRWLRVMRS